MPDMKYKIHKKYLLESTFSDSDGSIFCFEWVFTFASIFAVILLLRVPYFIINCEPFVVAYRARSICTVFLVCEHVFHINEWVNFSFRVVHNSHNRVYDSCFVNSQFDWKSTRKDGAFEPNERGVLWALVEEGEHH